MLLLVSYYTLILILTTTTPACSTSKQVCAIVLCLLANSQPPIDVCCLRVRVNPCFHNCDEQLRRQQGHDSFLRGKNNTKDSIVEWEVPAKRIGIPTTISPQLQVNIGVPPPRVKPLPPSGTVEELIRSETSWIDQQNADAQKLWGLLNLSVQQLSIAGVNCFHIVPEGVSTDYLLLHTHGGGYLFNGGPASTIESVWVANATRKPVLSIDYRMPPQNPSPAALEDVMAVWDAVVVNQCLYSLPPSRVGLFGGSAGGGLAMAAVLKLAEQGKPGPAALVLNSPWSDLTKTGDSYVINEMVDNMLGAYDLLLGIAAEAYADGKDLKDPYLSPIYGEFSVFPPTQIFTGTRDLFLSCSVRVHRKLRRVGIDTELHVFEGLSHNEWQPTFDVVSLAEGELPLEIRDSLDEITSFFERHLAG